MNNTNYWNQLSGDSQASNWNQENWASSPTQVDGTNPWLMKAQPYEGFKPVDWSQDGGSWEELMRKYQRPNMNDDHMKQDMRYGPETTAGLGAYWSGGRPGAGTWMEQIAAPVTAPANDMVPGANAQIPSRTAPVSEAQPYMINNVQMSATEPLSNWYLKEAAQEQTPIIPNVSNWGTGGGVKKRMF
jgi:hypothetical protein